MTAQAKTEITDLVARYFAAYAAKDAAGCAAAFTSDAVLLSRRGAPAKGADAIAALHSACFEDPEENKTYRLETPQIDGALACALLQFAADDEGARMYGATLVTFQHTGHAWKFHHMSLTALDDPLP